MRKYVARSYGMGAIRAEATFTAHSHDEAVRIANEKLGHSRHSQGPRGKVAVIGVKAL